jgi:hypothetical protein
VCARHFDNIQINFSFAAINYFVYFYLVDERNIIHINVREPEKCILKCYQIALHTLVAANGK